MGVEVRNGLREEQGDGWETKGDQKCTTVTKVLKVGQNQPLREWLEEGDNQESPEEEETNEELYYGFDDTWIFPQDIQLIKEDHIVFCILCLLGKNPKKKKSRL